MKRFILFLALFLCFSSFAHLCGKCSYVGCPGQIYGDSNSLVHDYRCDYYAGGAGHAVWSDETGIYPASCLTCGNLVCPVHGTHSGGKACPGACPNRTDCNKQTCPVCSFVFCSVHDWHGSQEIVFACGVMLWQCFSSESSMNSWLSSLNYSCSVSACTKCMTPWCRTHDSHNCSGGSGGDSGGGNTGGDSGGGNTGGNTGEDTGGGNTGGNSIANILTVTGTPASPPNFTFNKVQPIPTLDPNKINRSVVDQISKKLFPEEILIPSRGEDLFLEFTIPCNLICSYLPDYKLVLSSQSFWSNPAIVSAAFFVRTVTCFFFGWVTLLGFARALRQW